MTKKASKKLLMAVLEPRKNGAIGQIGEACAAGADPNGICPETSTSRGYVRGGSTLLTHSVHEWASRVVEKLLECGADPDRVDENGWTPWMASTLVDESKRDKIQALLSQYGASTQGDHIGKLARAIAHGNVAEASMLIQSDDDLKVLASFRVDLLGHQISSGSGAMLTFLLERGMSPDSGHLINAIRARSLPSVDLLLRFGVVPEDADEGETPLMAAAAMGELKIVQRLVEAGADVNRSADDNGEWTASFYARDAGKNNVADWLASRMHEDVAESDHGRA